VHDCADPATGHGEQPGPGECGNSDRDNGGGEDHGDDQSELELFGRWRSDEQGRDREDRQEEQDGVVEQADGGEARGDSRGWLACVDEHLGLDHASCGAATGEDLRCGAPGQLCSRGRTPSDPRSDGVVRIVPSERCCDATFRGERELGQPPERHQAAELEAR